MRLTVRILGCEVFHISNETEPDDTERDLSGGTLTSTPVGFTASWGDQRWDSGAEYGTGEPEDK